MKQNRNTFFYAVAAFAFILLANCSGKDGDPGPAGAPGAAGPPGAKGADVEDHILSEEGGVSGTLSGMYRNGTPFSETFAYNFTREKLVFTKSNRDNETFLILSRFEGNNQVDMAFEYKNKMIQPYNYYLSGDLLSGGNHFWWSKIKDNTLIEVEAIPNLEPLEVHWPIAPSENDAKYNFDFQVLRYGDLLVESSETAYVFYTKAGSRVAYDKVTGAFESLTDSQGKIIANTAPYSTLKLEEYPTFHFLDGNGSDISGDGMTSPDTFSISNYTFDDATGALKFDFQWKLGRDANTNSTGHPLTITGKVDILIYSDVISRKK